MNSKDKGKRGERQWAKFLTDRGHAARRGQQIKGTVDSPDVECESLGLFHFEVKHREKFSLYPALDQAIAECEDKIPVVAHRRNRKDWVVIMRAEDWLKLAERLSEPL